MQQELTSITLSASRETINYDESYLEPDTPPAFLNFYEKYGPILRREIAPLIVSILQGARAAAKAIEREEGEKDKSFAARQEEAASNYLVDYCIVYRGGGVVSISNDPGEPGVELIISGSDLDSYADVTGGGALSSRATSLIRECEATDKLVDILWKRQEPYILPRVNGTWETPEPKGAKPAQQAAPQQAAPQPVVNVTQVSKTEKKQGCVSGCASFLWLLVFVALFIAYCTGGKKDKEVPKDAPEAAAPATTPPEGETPQDGISQIENPPRQYEEVNRSQP